MRTTVVLEWRAQALPARAGSRHWLHVVLRWLRTALCGVRGHDFMLRFEPRRLCLECGTCGRQTTGWRLDAWHRRQGG